MTRLEPLTIEQAPAEARPIMEAAQEAAGHVGAGIGIMSRCPEVLIASRALNVMPAKSGTLSAELRGLVCLRAAQMITCPF